MQKRSIYYLVLFVLWIVPIIAGDNTTPTKNFANRKEISVTLEDAYPPYFFRDEKGNLQGILKDEWREWEKVTGVKVNFVVTNWADAQARVLNGEVDVIETLFRTKEREKLYDFSRAYADIEVPIFFDKAITGIKDVNSLKGFSVAVKQGDSNIRFLQQHGITQLVEYADCEAVTKSFAEQKTKIFVIDAPPAFYYIYKNHLESQIHFTKPLLVGQFHRAVKKGNTEVLTLVESGFEQIPSSVLRDINKKWLGTPLHAIHYIRYIITFFLISAALAIILLIINYTLKKKIKENTKMLREAFDELKMNEERFRIIEEKVNNGIWEWDFKSNHIRLSSTLQTLIFGDIRNNITYQDFIERIHRDDVEKVVRGDIDCRAGILDYNQNEYRLLFSDNKYHWVFTKSFTSTNEDGFQERMLGFITDVTEMRLVKRALLESENRFHSVMQFAHDAITVLNLEGNILYTNDSSKKLLGIIADKEVINHNIREFVVPEELDFVAEGEKAILEKGNFTNREFRIITSSGAIKTIDLSASLISEGEHKDNLILFIYRDITEQKLMQEALITEKERLAITLRSIGDGVITTDINGIILIFNKEAEQITEWHLDEAIGSSIQNIFYVADKQTRTRITNPIEKVISTKQLLEGHEDLVLLSKNGKEIDIEYCGSPVYDAQSSLSGVVLVFRNVTQKKQYENELLKNQKLESIGLLAGGVAHDFNNILTGILGNINVAKYFMQQPEKLTSLLDDAEKACLRASDLTRQLLTFAKGGVPIKKPGSLTALIQEAVKFSLRGSNVQVNYDLLNDELTCNFDEGQIYQVLNNIIINAKQAMPSGGTIHVSSKLIPKEEVHSFNPTYAKYVLISVRDEGIGINEKHLNQIFDPYFTTKQYGSGLGLATCYSIINKHEGSICCLSKLGKGATFEIYLPACSEDIKEHTSNNAPLSMGNGRILILDDEKIVTTVLTEMLKQMGYEGIVTHEGKATIDVFKNNLLSNEHFDAVILDLTIPGGMGGKETMKELLKIDPSVIGIVSSGYSNDPIMSEYTEHGFKAILMKPYRIHELADVLSSLILKKEV